MRTIKYPITEEEYATYLKADYTKIDEWLSKRFPDIYCGYGIYDVRIIKHYDIPVVELDIGDNCD